METGHESNSMFALHIRMTEWHSATVNFLDKRKKILDLNFEILKGYISITRSSRSSKLNQALAVRTESTFTNMWSRSRSLV